jgi:cell wall-associated NlpC family hydrolase
MLLAALTAAITVAGALVAPAWATPSYPSWAEVQAARKNVAKKKAIIKKLEAVIQAEAAEADKLGKVALIKGEAYNQAQDAVDVEAAKVDALQQQVNSAREQADQAKAQLGRIAAQMYRDGAIGTSLSMFLNAGKADDLLYKLGQQNQIASQSDTIYQRSIATAKYAQSLADDLTVAKNQLAAKAKIARDLYAEAKSAADAQQAVVDKNEALNKTFYAQLAVLQNTSAELERQRAEGLAAEARQNAGTSKPIAPELYSVGDANTSKVNIALNFAKAQLGEAYVLGGMGPSVWDCSGITKASYAAAGIYIGTHSATNQFNTMAAERKLVPLTQWQPGDLIWYSQSSSFNGDKYHVAIYIGDNLMLEAPNPARTVRIVGVRYGELFPYAGRPSAP